VLYNKKREVQTTKHLELIPETQVEFTESSEQEQQTSMESVIETQTPVIGE